MLLWPTQVLAQSVKLPSEVKVAAGRLTAVKVEWEGDDVWRDVPPDLDHFREYDPDPTMVRICLIRYAPAKYWRPAVPCKGGEL